MNGVVGNVALPDSGWKTFLKFAPGEQQVQIDGSGSQIVGDAGDYDPRCGPDITVTESGHPYDCKAAARRGDCEAGPGWMIMFCPNACGLCDLKADPSKRCNRERLNISDTPVYAPGEMNKVFEKLATAPEYQKYKPEILHKDPYVIKFHNFVSDAEIDALYKQTDGQFERSTDQGKFDEFGQQEKVVSTGRTSQNAWCMDTCERDETVQQLYSKISEATEIPYANFEAFQVLDYGPGQEYKTHHDQGQEEASDPSNIAGPRVLTFFLYLSDVEEGGETNFPDLGIKVKPEKGSAILWPSVTDGDLTKVEPLTMHAAMPVKKGRKFAANSWLHLYDYRTPNLWGCTGSFS
jgi:hypothetical protein